MADSELSLLRRYAATRDAEAFRALVERHQHMVFAACHRVLGNRADAEDATQNCFLKLAQAAGRLRAPIAGWLHKVAVEGAIDVLRQRASRRTREAEAAAQRTEGPEPSWEDVKPEVDKAIAALPDFLRQVLVLYYLEGRKQMEIAAEMGVDTSTASRWCKRYEQKYRGNLEGEMPADLISREVQKLDDAEQTARRLLQNAKSDRNKALYLAEIRRIVSLRMRIFLDCGLVERVPERLFKVISTLRLPEDQDHPQGPNRTREQLICDCLEVLKKTRPLA